jgi:hypothetical protein
VFFTYTTTGRTPNNCHLTALLHEAQVNKHNHYCCSCCSYNKVYTEGTNKFILPVSFTGASYLTTLTIQHAIFNEKCRSSSLECPYNIQQSPGTYQPKPPPLLPPLLPPNEDTGKSVLKCR